MTQQAHLSDAFPLANGVAIPCLGYGTWRMQDGAETVAAIQTGDRPGTRSGGGQAGAMPGRVPRPETDERAKSNMERLRRKLQQQKKKEEG